MQIVNMLQAKSTLSRLVEAIEQGEEREIVIARNGRPAAKLVPISGVPVERQVTIFANGTEIATVQATPENLDELAVGFLVSEGV